MSGSGTALTDAGRLSRLGGAAGSEERILALLEETPTDRVVRSSPIAMVTISRPAFTNILEIVSGLLLDHALGK
jgi:hypothetical protein